MSASYVARGKPCSPAASAPISTNCTPCCASVLRIRLGSSGATGARSDTAGMSEELAQVFDLFQTLLGGQAENPRDIVQHMRSHDDARFDLRAHLEIRRLQEPLPCVPGRARDALLDAGNHGLRGAGAAREGTLAEAGAGARLTQ